MDNFNFGGGGAFPGQQSVGGGAFGATRDDDDLNHLNLRPPALPALAFPGANYGGGVAEQSSSAARLLDGPTSGFQLPSYGMNNGLSGGLQCIAPGCDRLAQPHTSLNNSGGYCAYHFNSWLMSIGNQIDSWDCQCGNKVYGQNERCGNCHRLKDTTETFARTETTTASAACAPSVTDNGTMNMKPMTQVTASSDFQISDTRETNTNGRSLCKVVGCSKLDQSQNDGFCRTHFNMVSTPAIGSGNDGDSWNCVCGNMVSAKKKRCGQCNKWRGGKRDPYTAGPKKAAAPKKAASSKSKKSRVSNVKMDYGDNENWTCTCGNEVAATKARCGNCHHWRGGKRKGGWKIKSFGKSGVDDGIDWTQDWSCCERVIPAKKKRCGNCHGWRGGRRIASTKSSSKAKAMHPVWECPYCNILNPGNKKKCEGCEVMKNDLAIVKETGTNEGNDDKSQYSVTEFI